jgi:hypothetical protein
MKQLLCIKVKRCKRINNRLTSMFRYSKGWTYHDTKCNRLMLEPIEYNVYVDVDRNKNIK